MRWQAGSAAACPVALVALLAACGGPPPPATPAATPVDAAVDAPPPDPDHVELHTALSGFRDRACACSDAACAEQVEVDQVQWGFDHKPLLARVHTTPEQDRALHALTQETEACIHRLSGE